MKLRPIHSFESVVDELIEGLENGTITVAGRTDSSTRWGMATLADSVSDESTVRIDPATIEPEYDVFISYAGENRQEASQLAEALESRHVRVFYDQFEQATLWGANLYEYLADVYSHKAKGKFCVMLISAQYASKAWTSHERRFALERAFTENQPYILPVRLDDTVIPGVSQTIAYVDLRRTTVEKLAELVLEKLSNELP